MYTVYKIINKINNKFYIGVHKTDNPYDSYMGSGKAIKLAIEKYGLDQFKKEILLITESKKEAFDKEKDLTLNYSSSNMYNMKIGGQGGFSKENAKKGYIAANWSKTLLSENGKKNILKFSKDDLAKNGKKGGLGNKGKPKSEKHKQSLRDSWKKKKEAKANGEPGCS